MPGSTLWVEIDGQDLTGVFDPLVIEATIKDAAGENADTASIDLDDAGGRILMPRSGAKVSLGMANARCPPAMFEGVVDEVHSTGGRGQGMTLTIACKSADTRGKLKQPQERHKDDATFKEAAEAFAKETGVSVKIEGELGGLKRDYWWIGRESFIHWGRRIARELGATFKVVGDKAIFVPRNSGKSASGRALQPITAEYGRNLINWSLAPVLGRNSYAEFEVSYYDPKEAKWKRKTVKASSPAIDGATAKAVDRFAAGDGDSADQQAKGTSKEGDREKGGGSVEIDGESAAMAEAPCQVVGVRDGIDGEYRIESATHSYKRGSGFTTSLELKQPAGKAGQDGRNAK